MHPKDVLHVYLRNHWIGATVGLDLVVRVVGSHDSPDVVRRLEDVARQIREDRRTLREIMAAVGATPDQAGATAARIGERIGRLKPNGRLIRRSPVSDILELEALVVAVTAKRSGWIALLEVADEEAGLSTVHLHDLVHRADDQLEQLAEVHRTLAARNLGA